MRNWAHGRKTQPQLTQTGLRMDQAAMIYEGLTSTRRVSVGVGPAGSGKTHTVAAGARAWEASGGKVIGLTCAQAARDVLAAAGIQGELQHDPVLARVRARHANQAGDAVCG